MALNKSISWEIQDKRVHHEIYWEAYKLSNGGTNAAARERRGIDWRCFASLHILFQLNFEIFLNMMGMVIFPLHLDCHKSCMKLCVVGVVCCVWMDILDLVLLPLEFDPVAKESSSAPAYFEKPVKASWSAWVAGTQKFLEPSRMNDIWEMKLHGMRGSQSPSIRIFSDQYGMQTEISWLS